MFIEVFKVTRKSDGFSKEYYMINLSHVAWIKVNEQEYVMEKGKRMFRILFWNSPCVTKEVDCSLPMLRCCDGSGALEIDKSGEVAFGVGGTAYFISKRTLTELKKINIVKKEN